MNLSAVDLNLMVALDALLAERSVTRAAERIGLSQPAMSNALGRLRELFDDPLFVRAGGEMQPTPRALDVATPVRRALRELGSALEPPEAFDPETSTQVFRVGSADNIEFALLPRLIERLKCTAPGVRLEIGRLIGQAEQDLRSGRIDLVLGTWFDVPDVLHDQLLFQEEFVVIAREGHPALGSRLTLKRFVELGHVLVAPGGSPGGLVDNLLKERGLEREVVVLTPHFLVAPLIVARSDLICTLPRGVAQTFVELLPLRTFKPPLEVPGFPVNMVWAERCHESPPHRWLRGMIAELTGESGW